MKITGFNEAGFTSFLLDEDLRTRLPMLTGHVEDYIELTRKSLIVELESLFPSRMRRNGVLSAGNRMIEVQQKKRDKRSPLIVKPIPTDTRSYVIIDGNSTYFNLVFSGFKLTPVEIL